MSRPALHDYLDYREWLSAWFKWKKEQNPRFSHRALARRVGERSPSFLKDLITGRRNLTTVRRDALAEMMGLDDEEARYFRLLVAFDQAADQDEKRRVWETLAATRRFQRARQVEGDSYAYLSHWYYPAIRELVRIPEFTEDPEWVASQLRPVITPYQAEEALAVLWRLGMLVRNEDGSVAQADGSIATPRQIFGFAVHNYHRGMLDRAREGITGFLPQERHHLGVTVAIPEGLIPKLKEVIDDFGARVLDICESDENPDERVYQFHMTLTPLSGSKEGTS